MLGDLRRSHAPRFKLLNLGGINRGWTALIDASSLSLRDALHLPLLAEVGLEFREHAEHVEETLAGGGAGIDRLLCRLQRGALGPHGANDVLQVTDAAGEPVDPRDHQCIAWTEEVQNGLQLSDDGICRLAAHPESDITLLYGVAVPTFQVERCGGATRG